MNTLTVIIAILLIVIGWLLKKMGLLRSNRQYWENMNNESSDRIVRILEDLNRR